MTARWAALRALAEKATPSPWTVEPHDSSDKEIIILEPGIMVDHDDVDHAQAEATAAFIAASHPQAILALIAENERLRSEMELISGAIYERRGDVVVADPGSILAELVTAIANVANNALERDRGGDA